MTKADLVTNIGETITKLDNRLASGNPSMDSAEWQLLFATRKHLDDQQRELVAATIKDDDVGYKAATGIIKTAIDQLNTEIATQNKIDSIIKTASTISSGVDQILKQFGA